MFVHRIGAFRCILNSEKIFHVCFISAVIRYIRCTLDILLLIRICFLASHNASVLIWRLIVLPGGPLVAQLCISWTPSPASHHILFYMFMYWGNCKMPFDSFQCKLLHRHMLQQSSYGIVKNPKEKHFKYLYILEKKIFVEASGHHKCNSIFSHCAQPILTPRVSILAWHKVSLGISIMMFRNY